MADIVLGSLIAILLFFALRHVYHNVKAGREDCCGGGCSGCSGGCGGCSATHASAAKASFRSND